MVEALISAARIPSVEELLDLYDSVGWSHYTDDPRMLMAAVEGSLRVITAWDKLGHLIGLARAVGDGETIVYVQDVLVRPAWQRAGVGRWLVGELLSPYQHVQNQVLLTDNSDAQRKFYESIGFRETRELPNPRIAFVRHGS